MRIPLVRLYFVFVFLAAAYSLYGQSSLIGLTTRRDMVFDHAGKYLYISTSDGWVRRYNLGTGQLEEGYNLGGSLNGMDIAADDSFLLVAQDVVSGSQGIFHRVDLATGAVTNIVYNCSGSEAGAWDVAISSNGLALATTQLPRGYSGTTPLRQIDLIANSVTIRTDTPATVGPTGEVTAGTQIHRSADRTRLYLLEVNTSEGPAFTYDALSNAFGPIEASHMVFSTAAGAVNRNGALVGTLIGIYDPIPYSKPNATIDSAPDFHFRRGFAELDSGLAFDSVADVMYGISSTAGQIIAYDTNTFAEKFRLNIDEPVERMITPFGAGTLVASQDGRYLALATASGVRLFSVGAATPSTPPVPSFTTRRDMVFDHANRYLYLSTDNGLVERFDVGDRTLEIIANLGGQLNGMDIAPDDSFLLVTQDNYGIAEGMVQKVDLVTGQVTNLNYVRDAPEAGTWNVAIGSNGRALLTTAIPRGFSAYTPLRQINLANNVLTTRSDLPPGISQLNGGTHICRSADHTRMLLLESNGSGGGLFTYSAVTNTFGPVGLTRTFLDSSSAAVSRNGALIASRRGYPNQASVETAPGLHFVQPVAIDGGVAFNALNDTLYGVDRLKSEIIAYDAYSGIELYRFPVGEDVTPPDPIPGGPGPDTPELGYVKLVSSNDGRYLALETPMGFRLYDLLSVARTPPPAPVFGGMRGMVFDHAGKNLYVATASGFVWPYNLSIGRLETPYNVGGSLTGIDIAPDDSCLLVGQQATGIAEGRFEKITLGTGVISRINFHRNEIGWDVAIASNGLSFGITSSGTLFRIDLTSNIATARVSPTGALTSIRRSADATKLAFLSISRQIFFYTASSDTFGPSSGLDIVFDSSLALNRNGSMLGLRVDGTDLMTLPGLSTSHTFSDLTHAIVFDATKDTLYGVNPLTDEVVGYDSSTFAEQTRFPIGEDVSNIHPEDLRSGGFASSPNGRYLALQCDTALRVFDMSTTTSTAIPLLPRVSNISTRAYVGTGDNIPIAGFIVSGRDPKKVVLRAIGPSLAGAAISNALPDPTLELHDASGAVIGFNDNWKDSQDSEIRLSGLAPGNDFEAVLVKTLSPGTYTSVMRGANNGTGVGVVEIYDLEPNAISKLANISTRGLVGTGEQLMIAGVIVDSVDSYSPAGPRQLLVRGLGPSLSRLQVPNALADPILEIHNSNGTTAAINDDWKVSRETAIEATGLAPSDDRESAIFVNLQPGNFTALLRGKDNATGTGLIEVFALP